MCNCKKELEAEILKHATEQLPKSKVTSAEIQGYATAINIQTNDLTLRQALPIVIKHTVDTRNGPKQKVIKQNMLATYCMFCGEKQ